MLLRSVRLRGFWLRRVGLRSLRLGVAALMRRVSLELFESYLAIAVLVHFLEHLFSFGRILLRAGAGFELIKRQGGVGILVEFLEYRFRFGFRLVAALAGLLWFGIVCGEGQSRRENEGEEE